MNDCLFCKIIKGEIPSRKVYEDKNVYAFLDISPVNEGHTLVMPQKHYETILDAPSEVLCNLITVIRKIVPSILQAVKSESFNLQVNSGKTAGQIIPHLHFHIIPRFPDDGHHLFQQKNYQEGEIENIQKIILGISEGK